MGLGIRNIYAVESDVVLTSDAVLGTVGLLKNIAAGETVHIKAWVKITVGATGGVRLQLVTPAAVASFQASIRLNNTVAPSSTIATQQASAAFTNALANAGTHWVEVEATVVNGVNAGTIDLQFAQNTSDVLSLTVLAGSVMETVSY